MEPGDPGWVTMFLSKERIYHIRALPKNPAIVRVATLQEVPFSCLCVRVVQPATGVIRLAVCHVTELAVFLLQLTTCPRGVFNTCSKKYAVCFPVTYPLTWEPPIR